jgi:hypothetical protein
VKSKSERVLKLLERGPFLEEERERARKIAREIKGFGSFNLSSASHAVSQPGDDGSRGYGRSNSQYEERWRQDDGDRFGRSNDSQFEERWRHKDGDDSDKENLIQSPEPTTRVAREVEAEAEELHHHHPFHGFGQQRPEAMLLLSQ